MAGMQEIMSIRPADLEVAPTFQGSITEAPVNVYRMKVDAQSYDARRMSFTWRSPGNRLLCSPQAYLEFSLACSIPYNFTEAEALSAIAGHVDRSAAEDEVANSTSTRSTIVERHANGTEIAGMRSYGQAGLGANAGADLANHSQGTQIIIPGSAGYRAGLAFGEGDAVGNCIESIQYTINGCSISHQNWHLFKRSLDRCWIPSRVMQRVYYSAGGAWNAYDCVPLSGQTSRAVELNDNGGNFSQKVGAPTVEGFTADSGLARRMKNIFAAVTGKAEAADYPGGATSADVFNGSSFNVRIRFPLCGGIFNPCWGESGLSRSCPYQRLALAIPNLNQGSMTILFKDLERCVIRRLGRTLSKNLNTLRGTLINNSESEGLDNAHTTWNNDLGGAGGGYQQVVGTTTDVIDGTQCVPFTVVLATGAANVPSLHLTYLRLQAFRRMPEVASFTTFRTQTYLGPVPNAATMSDASVTALATAFDGGSTIQYLKCDGEQVVSKVPNAMAGYKADLRDKAKEWEVSFQNLQFAQPPSYILITAQKDSSMFAHKTPIQDLRVDLAAASGEEAYCQVPLSAALLGNRPAANNAAMLVAQQSAAKVSQQLAAGRYIAQNQDSNLAIVRLDLLVQSSVGSFKVTSDAYPYLRDQQMIYNEHKRNCCSAYFEKSGFSDWKKRASCVLLGVNQYLHGLGSSSGVAFPIQISADVTFSNKCQFIEGLYAYDEKCPRGPVVRHDCISARPVFVGIFDKQVIQIASSSAVLSAQNLSQASASQILASRA